MSQVRAIEDLFGEYIELKSEQAWIEYLSKLGAEEPKIRTQLEKLATAHAQAGSFLDGGTVSFDQTQS